MDVLESKEIHPFQLIGEGANGYVFSLKHRDINLEWKENDDYVLKIMKSPTKDKRDVQRWNNEYKNMTNMHKISIAPKIHKSIHMKNNNEGTECFGYIMERMHHSLNDCISYYLFRNINIDTFLETAFHEIVGKYKTLVANNKYCADIKLANIMVDTKGSPPQLLKLRFVDLDGEFCHSNEVYQEADKCIYTFLTLLSVFLETYLRFHTKVNNQGIIEVLEIFGNDDDLSLFKSNFDRLCSGDHCDVLPYITYMRDLIAERTGVRIEPPFSVMSEATSILAKVYLNKEIDLDKILARQQRSGGPKKKHKGKEKRVAVPEKRKKKKPAPRKRTAKSLACRYNIREASDIDHINNLLKKLKNDSSVFCTAQHAGSRRNDVFLKRIVRFANALVGDGQTHIELTTAERDAAVLFLCDENPELSRKELKFLVNHCILLMGKRLKRANMPADKSKKTEVMQKLLFKYILPSLSGTPKTQSQTQEQNESAEVAKRNIRSKVKKKKSGSKKSAGKGRKQNRGKRTTRTEAFYVAALAAKVLTKEEFDASGLNMAAKPPSNDKVRVFLTYDHAKSMFYITHKILMYSDNDMRRFWDDVEDVNGGPLNTRYGSSFETAVDNFMPFLEQVSEKVTGKPANELLNKLREVVKEDYKSLEKTKVVYQRTTSGELFTSSNKYKAFCNMPDLRIITNHTSNVEKSGARACRIQYDMVNKARIITKANGQSGESQSKKPKQRKQTGARKRAKRFTEEDYVSGKAPILDLYNNPRKFKMAKRVHEKIVKNTFPLTNEEKDTISQIFTSLEDIVNIDNIVTDLLVRDEERLGFFTDKCYEVMGNINTYGAFNDLMTRGYMYMFFLHPSKCPEIELAQPFLDQCSEILGHESFKLGEKHYLEISPQLIFPTTIHVVNELISLLENNTHYYIQNELAILALKSINDKGASDAKFVKAYYDGCFTADKNDFLVIWAMKLNIGEQKITPEYYEYNKKEYSNLKLDK